MKRLAVLSVFLLLAVCAMAQVVEVNKMTGDYRVRPKTADWQDTGITVDSSAAQYVSFFRQAINSPCQPVITFERRQVIKIRPFKELSRIERGKIIYDPCTKAISYEFLPGPSEERRSFYEIPAIIAMILMALSGIFPPTDKRWFWLIFALGAAFASFINIVVIVFLPVIPGWTEAIAIFLSATVIIPFFATPYLLVGAAPNGAPENRKKNAMYGRILFVLFYVLMIASFVMIYCS